jgi:hydrogenase maturation protease
MPRTMIIGVGNILLSDEGVGVAAARALMKEKLPAGVEVMDAGCALCDVIMGLDGFDRLIIVDAVRGGGDPGDIYRLDPDSLADGSPARRPLSLHETGVLESIAMARLAGTRLPPITIIGVEPHTIEPGTQLSEHLSSRMPDILKAVRNELGTTHESRP